jgi:hypothetical protein
MFFNMPTPSIIPNVKLLGHRPGLPGKAVFFHIVPLRPAYKAGLAGHVPVKNPAWGRQLCVE